MSPTPHPTASARHRAGISSTPSTPSPTTRIIPVQVLPTDQQVKQATLIDLSKHGDVDTGVYPNANTDPVQCGLVNAAAATSTTSNAVSVATVVYADKPGDDYIDSAVASVAAYNSAGDATAALAKIRDAAQHCSAYSVKEVDKPNDPPTQWTISELSADDQQVSWKATQQADSPWACGWTWRTHNQLLIAGMLCDHNPGGGGKALADVVIFNINAKS